MKFMFHWEVHPDRRQDVIAGFAAMELADYQSQQGPSIKVIGRWHDLVNARGVGICETDDPAALSAWLVKWNAVVDFDISVVHDDAEAHAILRKHVAESD
jgi:hypothetical protein